MDQGRILYTDVVSNVEWSWIEHTNFFLFFYGHVMDLEAALWLIEEVKFLASILSIACLKNTIVDCETYCATYNQY